MSGLTLSSPYVGLSAFGDDTARLFFGRDRESHLIIDSMDSRRLTLLFGERGVGKSSLLRSAVVPELSRRGAEDGAEQAVILFGSWRDDPAVALSEEVRAAEASAPADVYLIVDRLEEYFQYQGARDEFAAELAGLLSRRDLDVRVLLSVREDALGAVARFAPRLPGLFNGLIRIEHLDREAARAAIVGPLESYNQLTGAHTSIEEGLVERLLDELQMAHHIGDEPRIETPTLQLVLLRIWQEEQSQGSETLRLATLEALGGGARMLDAFVESAMDSLPRAEQDAAAAISQFLVTPSGHTISLTVDDLAAFSGVPEPQVAQVVARLTEARILRLATGRDGSHDRPVVEIFHDLLGPPLLQWQTRRERVGGRRHRAWFRR